MVSTGSLFVASTTQDSDTLISVSSDSFSTLSQSSSNIFTNVSNSFQILNSSLNTNSNMGIDQVAFLNEPYRNLESAAKKMKSMWLSKNSRNTGFKVYERNAFSSQPSSNWLDFKRIQEEFRLCHAVFKNNIVRSRFLLRQGVNPNCYDWQYRTPLHLAASRGYTDMVKLLLDFGADPNVVDSVGNVPLHLAACTNNVDVVLLLLKSGTNVNVIDTRGRSPLQLAQSKLKLIQKSSPDKTVKNKITEIVDMLLLFLKKKKAEDISTESELLESFQNRFKISETEEEVNKEIDNLSKMLEAMQCSVNNQAKETQQPSISQTNEVK